MGEARRRKVAGNTKPKGDKWKEPLFHLSKARYIAIGGNYLTRSKRRKT